MKEQNIKKIVLAYSGGLDTSVILAWLKDIYKCEVIAFAADIGQKEELSGLEEKALKTGAGKCVIKDLRREFIEEYIFPAVKAGAIYEKRYLLGTSLARPLIAKAQVEVALSEGADAVSHGATGKGNDQVRFELAFKALAPHLKIIAPWRLWDLNSRSSLINYAKEKNIPVPVSVEKPYSMDRNIMHLSFEGGILEDPFVEPDKDMFKLTKDPRDAPNDPEYIEISFDRGCPIAINGQALDPLALMERLNETASRHGIGRVDIVENRLVGIKSRGVYETPGATILHLAHRDLESITLDRDLQHYKDKISIDYANLIYNGLWFTPLKKSLDAFINQTQKYVSGVTRLRLFKGSAMVTGRKSPQSLYNPELATFEADALYNQKDAEGFINIFGLPSKMTGYRDQNS